MIGIGCLWMSRGDSTRYLHAFAKFSYTVCVETLLDHRKDDGPFSETYEWQICHKGRDTWVDIPITAEMPSVVSEVSQYQRMSTP